jgi:hypothetical protein
MDLQFRFRESALKHEVTEADIRHAFEIIELLGNSKTAKKYICL